MIGGASGPGNGIGFTGTHPSVALSVRDVERRPYAGSVEADQRPTRQTLDVGGRDQVNRPARLARRIC